MVGSTGSELEKGGWRFIGRVSSIGHLAIIVQGVVNHSGMDYSGHWEREKVDGWFWD